MPGGIGPLELAIGMREFKDTVTRKVDEDDDDQPQTLEPGTRVDSPAVDGEVVRERR
jgi:hypothetical protein